MRHSLIYIKWILTLLLFIGSLYYNDSTCTHFIYYLAVLIYILEKSHNKSYGAKKIIDCDCVMLLDGL